MLIRLILIIAGTLCLILGLIGVFVPGLPTTPFLLLTAGLYVRSSDRLYQRLIKNQYIGSHIANWQKNRTLPLRTKVVSIIMMWAMIALSVFMTSSVVLRLVIVLVGLTGTLVMGVIIPTGKKN
jgi:uncharacterized membrane protein YbaN (DUF454 family)